MIRIIYELDNHSPKYIYLLIKIENDNGELINCSLNFVKEYLIKEVEFSILNEKGPFLDDFEEKLENDVFDDVSLIFTDNLQKFDDFKEKLKSLNFLTYNNSFINLFVNSEKLRTFGNILVDCDMNRFFKYSGFINSFYKYPRIFGPNFEKGLNFVRKWYEIYKNQDPKENIKKIVILGGDFNIEKLKFLLYSKEFFEKIYLFGKIGFIFSLYVNNIEHEFLDDYTKQILDMFFQFFGPYEEKLIFSQFFFIVNEKVEENIQVLKDKNSLNFDKDIYLQKQKISENLSKIDLRLETTKNIFKSKNEIQKTTNSKSVIKSQKNFENEKSLQNIKKKSQKNLTIDENSKTIEEEIIKKKEKPEIIDYSYEIIEKLVEDIKNYDSILFIDYFSLQKKNIHLNLSLDYLLEKINDLVNFEEEIISKKNNLITKINILGDSIINQINNYDYKLISKIKRYLKKLEEKKKKKFLKKNSSQKNLSLTDEESESDEEEVEMSEDSDEENSVFSKEDEFMDMNLLCKKISSNVFGNSRFLVDLFGGRFSNGLEVYDEFEKKIVDPDEFDFSFIDEDI